MENNQDIRWLQRLNNYRKALAKLEHNIAYIKETFPYLNWESAEIYGEASRIEDIFRQGLIQSFEFTQELAWKVMQDFSRDQGIQDIRGSKDAIRYAAQYGLVEDAATWMSTIESRNESTHTYDENTANAIFADIIVSYLPVFKNFEHKMIQIRDGLQSNIF